MNSNTINHNSNKYLLELKQREFRKKFFETKELDTGLMEEKNQFCANAKTNLLKNKPI